MFENFSRQTINNLEESNKRVLEDSKLSFDKFLKSSWNVIDLDLSNSGNKFKDEFLFKDYINNTITLCVEPLEYISEFDDYAGNRDACREVFHKIKKSFRNTFNLPERHKDLGKYGWRNRTDKFINLRPGLLNGEKSSPIAVQLCDEVVHGVVAGRTGAGKSVFLNNLIFNLLYEYAPWELDLYLIDFKKVEFSRYMSVVETPHVCACGASSEVRYALSLFKHLEKMMKARQELFAKLGVQKISKFREEYPDLVMPRILMIVDEFQQMFLEASSRESKELNEIITSIVKLGRATGFHLIFASQEMSDSIDSRLFANFKLKFALPCDDNVSSTVLGNSAASKLEIGYVLVNSSSGRVEDNKRYRVPLIDDKYFNEFLAEQKLFSEYYGIKKIHKFYQEDFNDKEDVLVRVLNGVKKERSHIIYDENNRDILDILTLGNSVVYNKRVMDIESAFLQYGINKNIYIASPDIIDVAYVQKLLALNFVYSPLEYEHVVYQMNNVLQGIFDLRTVVGEEVKFYDDMDDFNSFSKVQNRMLLGKVFSACDLNADFSMNVYNFREKFIDFMIEIFGNSMSRNINDCINYIYDKYESSLSSCTNLDEVNNILGLIYEDNNEEYDFGLFIDTFMKFSYKYFNKIENSIKLFQPLVVWLSGVDSLDRLPRWFQDVAKNSVNYNVLFVICSTSLDDNLSEFRRVCDYYFVSGNLEVIYDRLGVRYSKNASGITFKIKSSDIERSFKKYKFNLKVKQVEYLDYDKIFNIY